MPPNWLGDLLRGFFLAYCILVAGLVTLYALPLLAFGEPRDQAAGASMLGGGALLIAVAFKGARG